MSLRVRLLCALALIAVVLFVSVVVLMGFVHTGLVYEVDRQLASLAPATAAPFGQPVVPIGSPALAGGSGPASPFTDVFIGQYGESGSLTWWLQPAGRPTPVVTSRTAQAHATSASHPTAFDARSSDGSSSFRVVVVRSADDRLTLVALPTDRIDATYRRVRLAVSAAAMVLLAALAVAGWWVERLGIRPIKRVTDAAVAIASGELDHRVEPQSPATEAGQLAQAFNVMVDERQAADQKLRQFVADVSHELRTPLTTIAGVLQLHQQGALVEESGLDEALRRAMQETERMSGLVSDLLLLAQLDQGRPLDDQPVDVSAVVADAALDASLSQRRRSITTQLSPGVLVRGDEERLRQVVTNLVTNAVSYTPETGHIDLSVQAVGDECIIEVRDDGPGMTAEQAGRVFDRFFRADVGRSRASGGTGLGLSIVASIVSAHHGNVVVESSPGHGATFRIELPRIA